MMHDHPDIETLSAYGDGELPALARTRVDAHVAQCTSCRGALAQVRALVASAAALPPDAEPPEAAWQEIRARIRREAGPRRVRRARRAWIGVGALAAAAVVLVAGNLLSRPGRSDKHFAGGTSAAVAALPAGLASVDRNYVASIAELRGTLEQQGRSLSPHTVRVLEHSLALIDTAIAEARAALAADPANAALAGILSAQYEHKLGLLQRVTKLVPAT